jgi:hypothetical protein
MTQHTLRCPHGHANPPGQKFCGTCGGSLVIICQRGHPNPSEKAYCGQCGSSLSALTPAPESASVGSLWTRIVGWWRGLSILKRIMVVLAFWLSIVLLSKVGAFESPKFRECVSYSKSEYRKNFGTKPVGQDLDSLEVVCRRLIDGGLWK